MRAYMAAHALLFFLPILVLLGCDGKSNRPDPESYEQKQERFRKALADLASAHNAIVDWQPKVDDLSLYSVDFERTMVRAEPIGFIGQATDVVRRAEKHQIIFENDVGTRKVLFRLQVEPQQVESVLKQRPSWIDDVAVIAKIDAVRSADLRLVHHALSEEDVEAEIESSDTVIVADGRCVAFEVLPDTIAKLENSSK